MKKILMSMIVCLFAVFPAFAENSPGGRDLLLYGDSAASAGRGGAGITSRGADVFGSNPASAAFAERVALSMQYGSLDKDYRYPGFAFLYPSSYGVFGISMRGVLMNDTSAGMEKGYLGMAGCGKEFTDTLMLGIGTEFLRAEGVSSNYYFGGIAGLIYHPKFSGTSMNGFGFFFPRFALALHAGAGRKKEIADMNQATAGMSFM
ncbi:MAG TPA: hypothetical protein PKK43_14360, partial [Spirochaetota bacterium]|nr:hypothetical protein [Spirochaetota bacterium]